MHRYCIFCNLFNYALAMHYFCYYTCILLYINVLLLFYAMHSGIPPRARVNVMFNFWNVFSFIFLFRKD
jgi:hypothetical protein